MQKIEITRSLIIVVTALMLTITIFPAFTTYSKDINEIKKQNEYNKKIVNQKEKASIYLERYNPDLKKIEKNHIMDVTLEEAEQLKEEMLSIQNTSCSNIEKIQQQLDIFHKWKILPPELSIEDFIIVMERLKKISTQDSIILSSLPTLSNIIVLGPSITSYLTFGGISYPLHLFLPEILEPYFLEQWLDITIDELLYGTKLESWVGILPVYIPMSLATTLIMSAGLVYGPTLVLSPFIAMEAVSVGFSIDIIILEEAYPVVVFDWCISVCLMGGIAYLFNQYTTP